MTVHPTVLSVPAPPGVIPRCAEARTRVVSNTPVNGEYRLLTLDAPAEVLACHPGQFFQLLCPEPDGEHPFLRRPMSIYGYDADAGQLQFLYKVTGAGTRGLATLKPDDGLNVLGPLGQGFTMPENRQNLLLLARGVGLATLAPLARMAQRKGRSLTAICSARRPELAMSVDLFRSYGAEVIVVHDADESATPEALRILIEAQIAKRRIDAFYTCGSARLLRLLQDIGARHGIPGEVAMEQQMACGIGMCQACVRSFHDGDQVVHRRVCREGPVFPISEAIA
ncbi:dihydroorotate dehydrogenase electron transfer subunit [Pseudooceanicola sediminis]|mgnify:CR=1 FL=1|uniref:Dihydroorotate dehydrogenase electron transfer subunit n=1 Tax=Pseudooceanicola sediminis TaxID=2211117 RepID=A0A399IYS0_9RHOB|nr:dihydroorotate dehydrogenase electron transfer subunit [Pseudooceanicola sediminis]KAA2312106.1 dihydroorotate dehydrogenase electron transfer subunit [Puniceibacterium sp. HSS470]RII38114.1 dihydroorotate dehydrogenase electron transfer subunit [Pseudooceanicola sediminis]|tara:strand:- start:3479 stop:4324 length:846 start_codon:yes stop_codon:yes gene_type:complete